MIEVSRLLAYVMSHVRHCSQYRGFSLGDAGCFVASPPDAARSFMKAFRANILASARSSHVMKVIRRGLHFSRNMFLVLSCFIDYAGAELRICRYYITWHDFMQNRAGRGFLSYLRYSLWGPSIRSPLRKVKRLRRHYRR